MARRITLARKDAAFQRVLKTIKEDTPEVPAWPFPGVSPGEWEALPERVRHNVNVALRSYVRSLARTHD